MNPIVYLDGNSLTLEEVVQVSRKGTKVKLTQEGKRKINESDRKSTRLNSSNV